MFWAGLVIASFVVMTASNVLASKGVFGDDNGKISNENPTYITPDGFTFAIWGLIYLFEGMLIVAQALPQSDDVFLRECRFTNLDVRQRLCIAFLANALWLPVFTKRLWWFSEVIILVYLAALASVYLDVNVNTVEGVYEQVLIAAPIALNLSWIVVATMLGFTVCGRNSGWVDQHGVGGSVTWGLFVIVLVSFLAAERLWRNDVAYAFVAGWALRGIYRMQTVPNEARFPVAAQSKRLAAVANCGCFALLVLLVPAVLVRKRVDAWTEWNESVEMRK
jgi:hypothetical protein